MNRLTWDFNNSAGVMVPPAVYAVKLTMGGWSDTKPLTLSIDPRLASDGVTAADLREQYDHNMRMHEMVLEVGRVANRIRQARTRLRANGNADSLSRVVPLATTMFGAGEGIRYGQPGLQTNVTYLAGMTTRADQRIGRDAVDRYLVLRRELDALEKRVNDVLGPEAMR
jgi:hypothetical protein